MSNKPIIDELEYAYYKGNDPLYEWRDGDEVYSATGNGKWLPCTRAFNKLLIVRRKRDNREDINMGDEIPDENTPMGTLVEVIGYEGEGWAPDKYQVGARLIRVDYSSPLPFMVLLKYPLGVKNYEFCRIKKGE